MAILVFGVGQLVLIPIAEHVVRQRLAAHGRVLSVSISAVPAIELIFGDADSATIRMATYTASQSQVAANLANASGVANLDVHVGTVHSGLLSISSVHMTKRGGHFAGSGVISDAALRAAVPLLRSVVPVASSHGQVTLQGTADVPILGSVSADVNVGAVNGKVVVSGAGLLDSFLHLTVWSNPHVDVESLSGAAGHQALLMSARWRLR